MFSKKLLARNLLDWGTNLALMAKFRECGKLLRKQRKISQNMAGWIRLVRKRNREL